MPTATFLDKKGRRHTFTLETGWGSARIKHESYDGLYYRRTNMRVHPAIRIGYAIDRFTAARKFKTFVKRVSRQWYNLDGRRR